MKKLLLPKSSWASKTICKISSMDKSTTMMTSTTDACTQTTPTKRMAPVVPDAPQRKIQRMCFMNSGRDIRRHLFTDYNWQKLEDVKGKNWAILKIETVGTSPCHRCIRRFYIGDENGINYLEMEFYPCITYKNLPDEYKKLYFLESSQSHRLSYNPRQRALPCSLAVSKIHDFIVQHGIEILLFNEDTGENEEAHLKICEELGIQHSNIRWKLNEYNPIPDHLIV